MLEENGFRNNTIISSVYVANENPLNRSLVERSYFVNNNFKTNTHFDYRSLFRPFVTHKQQQENEVKNVYYNFKVDIFFFFNLTPTKALPWLDIFSRYLLYPEIIFTYLFYTASRQYFLVDIQTIDSGMQWRTAKHVLKNGFNKTITCVNWAFAECLELGTNSTKNPHNPLNPITLFSFYQFLAISYKHEGLW